MSMSSISITTGTMRFAMQSDGREFPSTTRTLQKSGNLTIARLTADDHGLYECVARNVVADVITATFIIIEGLPLGLGADKWRS